MRGLQRGGLAGREPVSFPGGTDPTASVERRIPALFRAATAGQRPHGTGFHPADIEMHLRQIFLQRLKNRKHLVDFLEGLENPVEKCRRRKFLHMNSQHIHGLFRILHAVVSFPDHPGDRNAKDTRDAKFREMEIQMTLPWMRREAGTHSRRSASSR